MIASKNVGQVLRILGQNPTEDQIVEMVMKVRTYLRIVIISTKLRLTASGMGRCLRRTFLALVLRL